MVASDLLEMIRQSLYDQWSLQILRSEEFYRDALRKEVWQALDAQIQVRGLATRDWAIEMAKHADVRVISDQNNVTILFHDRWCWWVDQQFQAGTCERCSRYVPVPWNHESSECDKWLVEHVIEM